MNALALNISPVTFAAGRVTAYSNVTGIRRIPRPAHAAWESCRELLLDVAGDDEIAAIGIAYPRPVHHPAGLASAGIHQRGSGFALQSAVQRMFPAAIVHLATNCRCLQLAQQNTTIDAGADTVLIGAAILTRTAVRSYDPIAPRPASDLRITRIRISRRPSWPITCQQHRPTQP